MIFNSVQWFRRIVILLVLMASYSLADLRGWGMGLIESRELSEVNCTLTVCSVVEACSCDEPENKSVLQMTLEWCLIFVLIALSALFSGLTLGLMSLDKVGLEIVIGADPSSDQAKYARVIQPWRNQGNQLLCTLLLGNVSVNALLSIVMASYTNGIIGFILSTFLIVTFGEILPQATCSRHALWVGAKTIYILIFFFYLMYPISKPFSMMLDWIFGDEIGMIYSSKELSQLVEIHKKHDQLDDDQALIMGGAIQFKNKTVEDVYTRAADVFMVDVEAILDFSMVSQIFEKGFSRMPVYQNNDKNDICGLLFAKDLILIDPEEGYSVKAVIQFFGRPVQWLWPDTPLQQALALFRTGKCHLALVRNVNNDNPSVDPYYEFAGLVTLEDIIEEILQVEILDEADFIDEPMTTTLNRGSFDFTRLKLLDNHRKNTLTDDEGRAISAHLAMNLSQFRDAMAGNLINIDQLASMIKDKHVIEMKQGDRLYTKGEPVNACTLLLSGKVQVVSGKEAFRSSVGPWSFLGHGALEGNGKVYTSDFDAVVSADEGIRCIEIYPSDIDKLLVGIATTPPSPRKDVVLPEPSPSSAAAKQDKKSFAFNIVRSKHAKVGLERSGSSQGKSEYYLLGDDSD